MYAYNFKIVSKFHERTLTIHSFISFNPREYYLLTSLRNNIKRKVDGRHSFQKLAASGRIEKQKDYSLVSL